MSRDNLPVNRNKMNMSSTMDEKYIIHGPKPWAPLTKKSVGIQLYERLLENIQLPVIFIDAITGESVSNKTILEKSCRLARSLQKYGIVQNSVVAICSENSLEFFYPVLAAMYLGVTITTFNPYYTAREILHCANISKPAAIFCSKMTLDTIKEAKDKMDFVRDIIVIDADEKQESCESLADFMSNNSNEQTNIADFKPTALETTQQVAFILYSSGTTGLPKGVMLTHNNINAVLSMLEDPRYVNKFKPGTESSLGLMPFYHAYGLSVGLASLLTGRRLIILNLFEPELFLKTIQDYKITILNIVPPLANFLAKSPLVDRYDLSSVEILGCGAAPLSKNTEEILHKRLKFKWFRQAYGMTETTLGVIGFPVGENKSGSCGKVLPNASAKVVDPDTGKILGPGQRGELCFKGCLIMKGYAGNEEATAQAIDKNGWLSTGDVGYYDDDGCFYIVDRLKELIKYKGFQVPPAELEALLLTHPKIIDAGVVGLPDDASGELPTAFVVKDSGQELTEQEVINFVDKQVSPQKRLRGGVKFVSEIPKNPSGKIMRRVLRDLLHPKKSKL